jgi:hypothetical protein
MDAEETMYAIPPLPQVHHCLRDIEPGHHEVVSTWHRHKGRLYQVLHSLTCPSAK